MQEARVVDHTFLCTRVDDEACKSQHPFVKGVFAVIVGGLLWLALAREHDRNPSGVQQCRPSVTPALPATREAQASRPHRAVRAAVLPRAKDPS